MTTNQIYNLRHNETINLEGMLLEVTAELEHRLQKIKRHMEAGDLNEAAATFLRYVETDTTVTVSSMTASRARLQMLNDILDEENN